MVVLVPIVEGQGEVEAVPNLLHRIAASGPTDVRVNPPIRVKVSAFLHDDHYFRRYLELAGAKAAHAHGHVLILLDCEDACPARLGPELLRRARQVRADVNTLVVLAYREYETWFVTAARSLRGLQGLPADLEAPSEPEAIRDAKGWLSERMTYPYDPVVHQVEFTRAFDLEAARENKSFQRLRDRVDALFEAG